MLTAAVRELHLAYPGHYLTDIRTSAGALWENSPYLTPLREGNPGVEVLDMHYPLVHQSNQRPYHFIHGYVQFLEQHLGARLPVTRFQGDIHLSDSEREALPQCAAGLVPEGFWIIVAGGKYDYTAKWWDPACFQAVVDHFRGRIAFVQCGAEEHWHPRLQGAIDLVGKTSLRDFVRLMHFAAGVVCPVTLAMHLAAAVPTRPGRPKQRACVVIAGGREPPHWEAYPHHQFISTNGALPCCEEGGCWRSRCQLVGDGDDKDRHNLCDHPVQVAPELRIPKCLHMIRPEDVIRRVAMYYEGGALRYGCPEVTGGVPTPIDQQTSPSPVARGARPTSAETNVLIRFRHGLGDAVQLTTVLQHLRHYRPDLKVEVAALVGKHTAFQGLCWKASVLHPDATPPGRSDRTVNLEWPECATCYRDWPSTKAERCLLEVFRLTPIPELCRYAVQRGERATEAARRYLQLVCQVRAGEDGRFPVVLIHYEGNTSTEMKNLPLEVVRRLCDDVLDRGLVPVILDWDWRTPLADGRRIHNPHANLELWGGTGTGDAEVLAALIEQSRLLVGVDSGPLHVAGATSTPTIGVWTGHHPLHYFGHAENVLHLVPENHSQLLRGDPTLGGAYFRDHYRFQTYPDLEVSLREAVRGRLRGSGGLRSPSEGPKFGPTMKASL